MAKKKIKLNQEELQHIEAINRSYKLTLETFERAKQFKSGDYLIMSYINDDGTLSKDVNSYGVPRKFIVVDAQDNGAPFVKEINAKGTPIGEISCILTNIDNDSYLDDSSSPTFWELDPDYADSILLAQDYDHAQLHNTKKVQWKEVTEHNKKAKVSTESMSDIDNFLNTIQPSYTIWTSHVSHYTINKMELMPRADANKVASISQRVKGSMIMILTMTDKKGNTKVVAPDFFWRKALYRERPRTYKELNL